MILGLFTELLAPGGVQRVGRHTFAVLTALAREQGLSCRLLSLNDPSGRHELRVGDLAVTFQGFGRRKARFVLAVLAEAPRVRLAHIGHPNLAPLGLLVKLLRPSARYSVAAHGFEVWESLPLVRRLGLRLAHVVTAPSQFTREKMVAVQKLNPEKTRVLPWALDAGFLRMDGTTALPKPRLPSGKLLLTVARLAASERQKGMDAVIRTLPRVLEVVRDTYYLIVGDGDDRLRLQHLAEEEGVADRVLFAGTRSDDELASYYDACDIFVMPSRQEGFGVVFLEAMAFGKPVIGGKHGGTPEVVIDGVTGFLVQHGDVEGLAFRLIQLLRDPELCNRMGAAGRRLVEENYTFEHFRRGLVQPLTGGNGCEF
ncbi:MAG: glycosyltransferase family 4 protein [Nitrospinota bacterium]